MMTATPPRPGTTCGCSISPPTACASGAPPACRSRVSRAISCCRRCCRPEPDGTGGMIVGWLDWRNPSYGNVYAQRVDASGATQWATNGVPVVAGAYEQALLHCVEDATGGMLLVWQDDRSTRWHVYAQRLG